MHFVFFWRTVVCFLTWCGSAVSASLPLRLASLPTTCIGSASSSLFGRSFSLLLLSPFFLSLASFSVLFFVLRSKSQTSFSWLLWVWWSVGYHLSVFAYPLCLFLSCRMGLSLFVTSEASSQISTVISYKEASISIRRLRKVWQIDRDLDRLKLDRQIQTRRRRNITSLKRQRRDHQYRKTPWTETREDSVRLSFFFVCFLLLHLLSLALYLQSTSSSLPSWFRVFTSLTHPCAGLLRGSAYRSRRSSSW